MQFGQDSRWQALVDEPVERLLDHHGHAAAGALIRRLYGALGRPSAL